MSNVSRHPHRISLATVVLDPRSDPSDREKGETMINSREKGADNERAVAHLFQKFGYKAERGCQHDGLSGHADVVGVPYIWIEVKAVEKLKVEKAMQQAERDSRAYLERTGDDLLPVVIHKKNYQGWKVSMRLHDLIYLCGAAPFSVDIPDNGLVQMEWEDWIKVYMVYEAERSAG